MEAFRGDYNISKEHFGTTIKEINSNVNEIFEYRREKKDHWKKPMEMALDGYGDCEDFAIFKYHALKQLGHNVKVLVVHMYKKAEDHAVLLVDDKYVLDNMTDNILEYDTFMKDKKLWYVINEYNVGVAPPDNLSKGA